jgi:hypothetical protein
MNYEKFSKQQFLLRGTDTTAAQKLADELQEAVAQEMHQTVLAKFSTIVEELNALGHHLVPYDEIAVGDLTFRDEPTEGDCRLRLACDVVISAGYADTEPPSKAADTFGK